MASVFGWWDFDAEVVALVNRVTGQRLVLIGRQPGDAVATPSLRFRYEDRDTHFPLIVRRPPLARPGPQYTSWLVDYAASTQVWRRRAGTTGVLPYGLWRRVDDSVIDALLCWPEIVQSGPKVERIESTGGWLNGAWTDGLCRRFGAQFFDWATKGQAIATVSLESLDLPPPLPWRYHSAPFARQGARIAGIERPNERYVYLPAEAALTGFERDVPYLKRSDGRAVMFPSGLSSYFFRGEDYTAQAQIDYADEDVLLRLGCENRSLRQDDLTYRFRSSSFFASQIGLRDRNRFDPASANGMPAELFPLETPYRGAAPSYRLWHRLREALVDGWLQWTGSVHMAETPQWLKQQERSQHGGFGVPADSGMMFAPPSRVQVEGAYIGGLLTSLAEQLAWLAPAT